MSSNLIHLVTATKYRRTVQPEVAAYIQEDADRVLLRLGVQPLAIGFDANHMHVLFDLPRTRTLEEIARRLKATTSKHVREQFPDLRDEISQSAFWQRRFLYTSLGGMTAKQTQKYIKRQRAFS